MRNRAFTIVEIMVVMAILGLLLTFALYNSMTGREKIYREECIDNLRRIHTAKELFANEHNKNTSYLPTAGDISPYIKGGTASLVCPDDPGKSFNTSYNINNVGTAAPPACRIKGEHAITP